jgi:hypothetical protein
MPFTIVMPKESVASYAVHADLYWILAGSFPQQHQALICLPIEHPASGLTIRDVNLQLALTIAGSSVKTRAQERRPRLQDNHESRLYDGCQSDPTFCNLAVPPRPTQAQEHTRLRPATTSVLPRSQSPPPSSPHPSHHPRHSERAPADPEKEIQAEIRPSPWNQQNGLARGGRRG